SVGHYLPEFTGNGKEKITVRDLLLHVSGIRDEYKTTGTEEEIWKSICNTEVKNRPGKKYEYSCLSYVILGKLIERISGEPLCVFAKKNIYDLLCMKDTGFQPNEKLRARTAPTEKREGKWLKGNVNDWRNAAMGGGAGNAGLFSTGIDLAILAQVLLNHGIYTDSKGIQKRLFCEETFQKMVAPYKVPAGYRGLSWDKATGKPNLPPEFFPTAIGHGGHTGTSFLVDPERDLFVIVLTTRLHLNPKNPNIYPTAGEIARITAKMFQAADQPKNRID
ncbi:MAG: serine hydrolase domain-containing protein, partial [Planctomycetia bacterium]|nr:serine hydrolase domain-containing protein [Planctomycetia bacterium]